MKAGQFDNATSYSFYEQPSSLLCKVHASGTFPSLISMTRIIKKARSIRVIMTAFSLRWQVPYFQTCNQPYSKLGWTSEAVNNITLILQNHIPQYAGLWGPPTTFQDIRSLRGPGSGCIGPRPVPSGRDPPLWHLLTPCSSLSHKITGDDAVKSLLC